MLYGANGKFQGESSTSTLTKGCNDIEWRERYLKMLLKFCVIKS